MKNRICKDKPISSKELVDLYLQNVLQKKKPLAFEISEKWDIIIKSKLKNHLKIKEIKDGVLILVADHPAWVQKANMSKKNILNNIQKEFPVSNIKSIHIICR